MSTEIVGVSHNIQRIKELIEQVADTGLNTLVCGETGVGKELVVQKLYERSNRMGKPFVKVNCAALPDGLLESELFGYEQGAFTGAQRRRRGKFELAHGGVLFLDEIGDMSAEAQAKILRTIEYGEIQRVGGNETLHVDVRIVAATNRDLLQAIHNGLFREDLYYRLATITITLPPLRNRKSDIPQIAERMGRPASALYYHVRLLEKVGLVKHVGERPGRKRPEALYAPVAPRIALPASCGDGVTDSAEVCDDGNVIAGDGCNATFHTELCWN